MNLVKALLLLSCLLSSRCSGVCHLCAALPVLLSVRLGHNATLSCNLTRNDEVTWFLVRVDELLPLLTVRSSHVSQDFVVDYAAHTSRLNSEGSAETGSVSLDILTVEPGDAGLYVCVGRNAGAVRVSRGTRLAVTGERFGEFTHLLVWPALQAVDT